MSRKGIMLAYPFERRRLSTWEPPYIVQPKLDGDRCRAIFDDRGKVTLLSSEENIITSVPHVNADLEKLHYKGVEFDGELYSHEVPHSDIHGIVSTKREVPSDSGIISYNIFDIVDDTIQALRMRTVQVLLHNAGLQSVKLVPFFVATSYEDIIQFLDRFVDEGYEGIIVRNKWNQYIRRRSTLMMKFKPRRMDSYMIIGSVEEVSKDNVPKGTLGALTCRGDDSSTFNVGSGFTREQRENFWSIRESLIGKFAVVKYQHLTSTRGVPREGIFVEIAESGDSHSIEFPEIPEIGG